MSSTSPELPIPGDAGVVDEEREFVWDDYLEDTQSTAAPATSFKHVRSVLRTTACNAKRIFATAEASVCLSVRLSHCCIVSKRRN